MSRVIRFSLVFVAVTAIAACGRSDDVGGLETNSPDHAILALVESLRTNDLEQFLRRAMSEKEYARARLEWDEARAGAIDESDREQLNAALTALDDDAFVDGLMAEVEPALEAARPNLPLMLMAAQTMGHARISANEKLTESQKNAANELLAALGKWAGSRDLANPELVRKALTGWVNDAKEINLKNAGELQALEFEEMVARAGILMSATENMLAVYGFKLDDIYASATAEVLRQQGDTALVRIRFDVLDTQQQFDVVLVRQNDRWLPEGDLLDLREVDFSEQREAAGI